jgi:hypothetical protein
LLASPCPTSPRSAEPTRPLIFLLDQSSSMLEPFGSQPEKSKVAGVADALNRLLQNLVLKCAKADGIRDFFHVGLISYGGACDVRLRRRQKPAPSGPAMGTRSSGTVFALRGAVCCASLVMSIISQHRLRPWLGHSDRTSGQADRGFCGMLLRRVSCVAKLPREEYAPSCDGEACSCGQLKTMASQAKSSRS